MHAVQNFGEGTHLLVFIVMCTTLRVIPTSIYDRLVENGTLEIELLKDSISLKAAAKVNSVADQVQSQKSAEDEPTQVEPAQVETSPISEETAPVEPTQIPETTTGENKISKKTKNCWIKFEDKYKLLP